MIVSINNKEYKVKVAKTEEEKEKGLLGVTNLPKDEGMLFIYDEPLTVRFWMDLTEIPLDIIFINEDEQVISVYKGQPNDQTIVEEDDVLYVLELNQNSGVKKGDELEFEEDSKLPTMKVIASDGSVLMELEGGERIFSRKNTKTIIRMAKRADASKLDKDYKRLGKKMFQYLEQQDTREPEYVEKKD